MFQKPSNEVKFCNRCKRNYSISNFRRTVNGRKRIYSRCLQCSNSLSSPVEVLKSLYEQGLTCREIGNKFSIHEEVVRSRLTKSGLVLRSSRKHFFDESKFDLMDADSSYWLGFIYADGNVYKGELSIKLGLKDLGHLEKFSSFIGYTGPITYTKGYPRFRMYSPELCSKLENYGVHPNKTNSLCFPETGFDIDFIRGFFDGDGWRCKSTLGFSSCSKDFIYTIKQKLNQGIGREVGSVIEVNRKGVNSVPNYCLHLGGSKVISAINDFLWYEGCQCLLRKSPS